MIATLQLTKKVSDVRRLHDTLIHHGGELLVVALEILTTCFRRSKAHNVQPFPVLRHAVMPGIVYAPRHPVHRMVRMIRTFETAQELKDGREGFFVRRGQEVLHVLENKDCRCPTTNVIEDAIEDSPPCIIDSIVLAG